MVDAVVVRSSDKLDVGVAELGQDALKQLSGVLGGGAVLYEPGDFCVMDRFEMDSTVERDLNIVEHANDLAVDDAHV